jgi:hypothetical protein
MRLDILVDLQRLVTLILAPPLGAASLGLAPRTLFWSSPAIFSTNMFWVFLNSPCGETHVQKFN